jgi:hypothetical protein
MRLISLKLFDQFLDVLFAFRPKMGLDLRHERSYRTHAVLQLVATVEYSQQLYANYGWKPRDAIRNDTSIHFRSIHLYSVFDWLMPCLPFFVEWSISLFRWPRTKPSKSMAPERKLFVYGHRHAIAPCRRNHEHTMLSAGAYRPVAEKEAVNGGAVWGFVSTTPTLTRITGAVLTVLFVLRQKTQPFRLLTITKLASRQYWPTSAAVTLDWLRDVTRTLRSTPAHSISWWMNSRQASIELLQSHIVQRHTWLQVNWRNNVKEGWNSNRNCWMPEGRRWQPLRWFC